MKTAADLSISVMLQILTLELNLDEKKTCRAVNWTTWQVQPGDIDLDEPRLMQLL